MDYGIFNVPTDVNVSDCTRRCTDIERECTKSSLWEENPLPHRRIESASAASRSDDLPTELHTLPFEESNASAVIIEAFVVSWDSYLVLGS